MKVTIEVDCTAEEARDFIGLPNLKPLQASVLARVEQQMVDATSALSPESVLNTWFAVLPQASERYMKAMAELLSLRPKDSTDAH